MVRLLVLKVVYWGCAALAVALCIGGAVGLFIEWHRQGADELLRLHAIRAEQDTMVIGAWIWMAGAALRDIFGGGL